MHAWLFRLPLLLVLLFALPVLTPSGDALAQTAAAPAASPDRAELESLIATLEDEEARARLVGQLRTLLEAQEAQAPAGGAVGTRIMQLLSDRIAIVSGEVVGAANILQNLPALADWVVGEVTEPDRRSRILDVIWKIVLVIGTGWVAQRLFLWLLSRPRRALEARTPTRIVGRVTVGISMALMEVVPIAAFAAAAYLVLPLTEPREVTRLVALAIINASVLNRVVTGITRILLRPYGTTLRLVPITHETAAYLYVWIGRLSTLILYSYFGLQAALLLGLPAGGFRTIATLIGLAVAILVVILTLQNRAAVGTWIRGAENGDGRSALRVIRARLADVWHVLICAYVLAIYAIWAMGIDGGFEFVLRATLLTLVILVATRALDLGIAKLVRRVFSISHELAAKVPGLEIRANRYRDVFEATLRVVLYLFATLSLMQAWGIGTYEWLSSESGRRIIASGISITLILFVALLVWETASAFIERYLNRMDAATGLVVQRSARVRTLLPLVRNFLLVVLITIVGLIILSELGVNIAPLLAGAGVVGLAIGFGAQTLVRDVITGLFMLFEDTVSVGDVVDVGSHSGLVEAITIRSIRLRDMTGTVHTVPFSSVASVKNMTKDFSFAVFNVGVAYRENLDEVIALLHQIAEAMRADPAFAPDILEPLEVLGVSEFQDSAVNILARMKTRPIKQWGITRAFNKRMKEAFDAAGIEIPFPHQTIYFGVEKDGTAPPARLRFEREAARAARPAALPEPPVAGSPGDGETVSGAADDMAARARGTDAVVDPQSDEDPPHPR